MYITRRLAKYLIVITDYSRPDPNGVSKNKLRPGDILGALTGEGGITGSEVGKIDVFDSTAFVAIVRSSAGQALDCLRRNKIKGRFYKVSTFQSIS